MVTPAMVMWVTTSVYTSSRQPVACKRPVSSQSKRALKSSFMRSLIGPSPR